MHLLLAAQGPVRVRRVGLVAVASRGAGDVRARLEGGVATLLHLGRPEHVRLRLVGLLERRQLGDDLRVGYGVWGIGYRVSGIGYWVLG